MADKKTTSQLRSKLRWGIVGIFALLIVSGIFIMPKAYNYVAEKATNNLGIGIPTINDQGFKLGLDLQGGVHLIYEADVSAIDAEEINSAVEGVRDVVERRVNGMGVGEPNVQTTKVKESHRLIVELPGVTDVHQAIEMIGETPILEFKEENNIPPRELTEEEKKQLDDFNFEAEKKAEEILQRIKDGESFEEVAKEVSEDETSKNNGGYLGFASEANEFRSLVPNVKDLAEDQVSKSVFENAEGFNIVKRGLQQEGDKQVKASHILICFLGSAACENSEITKEEAFKKANDLFEKATPENFTDLAKKNSDDLTNKEFGGDLGFFGKNAMVGPFDQAVFDAGVGDIIGPVETQFGYHLIYKSDERVLQEYETWRILVRSQSEADILPPQDPWMNTGLSGKQLDHAEVVTDNFTGETQVSLVFDKEGADLFKEITERHVGEPVAIFLDGEPISIPRVNTVITDGRAVITGNFSIQEARLLSQRLNAGALPVPINLISQQAIGASLGAETLTSSMKAALIALMLVMLFMVLYYRVPGVLSVVSLAVYVSVTMSIFKIMGVTMTLAGIAGVILSIGMAVDANVLIFERLKEELKEGKSLKAAVEEGFIRAWTSIRDGNVSTLITCALLIWFGSSFVQGFAVTLAIGILVSMFTAITITRAMLRFIVPWFKKNDGGMMFLGTKKE